MSETSTSAESPDSYSGSRDYHLFGPGPKRILALDGGGVRGAISVAFLERIEEILAEEHTDAVLVPAAAVAEEDGKAAVFVVGKDGTAHRREVTLGLTTLEDVEIATGIAAGETVIVKGHDALPDGATVTVEPAAP